MMRTSVFLSAMRLGPLELPWLGRDHIPQLTCLSRTLNLCPYSIHERSAREKISSDQVAHVLNDEVSRKYIQSLKR
jgi:Prp18 domain